MSRVRRLAVLLPLLCAAAPAWADDADTLIAQGQKLAAAWVAAADDLGGLDAATPFAKLVPAYLDAVPVPPAAVSDDSYAPVRMMDRDATSGFDGIILKLRMESDPVCKQIAKASGGIAALPTIVTGGLAAPSAGRDHDCIYTDMQPPGLGPEDEKYFVIRLPKLAEKRS